MPLVKICFNIWAINKLVDLGMSLYIWKWIQLNRSKMGKVMCELQIFIPLFKNWLKPSQLFIRKGSSCHEFELCVLLLGCLAEGLCCKWNRDGKAKWQNVFPSLSSWTCKCSHGPHTIKYYHIWKSGEGLEAVVYKHSKTRLGYKS